MWWFFANAATAANFRCLGGVAACTPLVRLGEGSAALVDRVRIDVDPGAQHRSLSSVPAPPLYAVAKSFRSAPLLDSAADGEAAAPLDSADRRRRAAWTLRAERKEVEMCRHVRPSPHIPVCLHASPRTASRPTTLLFEDWGAGLVTQSDLLAPGAPALTCAARLAIGLHVARALHALHAQHIQHLDVQPANVGILLDGAGGVRRAGLFDFGLAETNRALRDGATVPIAHAAFAAPELQRTLRPAVNGSDIFSWALLQLHVWGACPAFAAASPLRDAGAAGAGNATARAALRHNCWRVDTRRDAASGAIALPWWVDNDATYLSLIDAAVARRVPGAVMPRALGALLTRCLARDPKRRLASAAHVVAAMEALLAAATTAEAAGGAADRDRPGATTTLSPGQAATRIAAAAAAATEGELILCTVTLCANSANDLTCPPHIL